MLISFYDRQVKNREKRRKLGYNNIDTLQKKKRRTKWGKREREREKISLNYNGAGERIRKKKSRAF